MKKVVFMTQCDTCTPDGIENYGGYLTDDLNKAAKHAVSVWDNLPESERKITSCYVESYTIDLPDGVTYEDAPNEVYGCFLGIDRLYVSHILSGRSFVANSSGAIYDYSMLVNSMDDELREEVHAELAPCTDQEFYDRYCVLHEQKYGASFMPF